METPFIANPTARTRVLSLRTCSTLVEAKRRSCIHRSTGISLRSTSGLLRAESAPLRTIAFVPVLAGPLATALATLRSSPSCDARAPLRNRFRPSPSVRRTVRPGSGDEQGALASPRRPRFALAEGALGLGQASGLGLESAVYRRVPSGGEGNCQSPRRSRVWSDAVLTPRLSRVGLGALTGCPMDRR